MAEVGTMYPVQPPYNLKEEVVISDVMYKVKPIITGTGDEFDGKFEDLNQRQDVLLERLDHLISSASQSSSTSQNLTLNQRQDVLLERLDHLISSASQSSSTSQNSISELFHTDYPVDLVIRADPKKPLHWLSYVKKQLNCQKIQTWWKFHVHSSVTDNLEASTFPRKVPHEDRHRFQLIVTVIWSNESCSPSLHICPSIRTAIYGEANIARFFGRILGVYDTVSSQKEDVITDLCLDLCEIVISTSSTKQEKANAVKSLSLAIGSWFSSDVMTLPSAFLASCVGNHGLNNVPQENLQNWFKKQKTCLDF